MFPKVIVRRRGNGPFYEHNVGVGHLTEPVVLMTEYTGLFDPWIGFQDLFHLLRENFHAGDADHFLGTAKNMEIAVFIHLAQIARPEPAVRHDFIAWFPRLIIGVDDALAAD